MRKKSSFSLFPSFGEGAGSSKSSPLHRLKAGWKVGALLILGTALFSTRELSALLCVFALILSGYAIAKISLKQMVRHIKPLLPLLVVVMVAQLLLGSLTIALSVTIRFLTLFLAASLMTLTTPLNAIVKSIERLFTPFSRLISLSKVNLVLSLTFRWIPSLIALIERIREAQFARAAKLSPLALPMALAIQVIKQGEVIAEAVESRSSKGLD